MVVNNQCIVCTIAVSKTKRKKEGCCDIKRYSNMQKFQI
jgi:hypothetical protein